MACAQFLSMNDRTLVKSEDLQVENYAVMAFILYSIATVLNVVLLGKWATKNVGCCQQLRLLNRLNLHQSMKST